MFRYIYKVAILSLIIGFSGCDDKDEVINPDSKPSEITFAYDMDLDIDMNEVDNLPIIAVITSEAGLKEVKMTIETEDEVIDFKSVAEFFNENSYSLSENINYKPNYKSFTVEAIDKLNRSEKATLKLNITEVMDGPEIVFDPEMIEYDELEGGVMPNTMFSINSVAGLVRLEMFLVTQDEQIQYGYTIDSFDDPHQFEFDEKINYVEGDKGFRVKATDIYDKVKIITMPVNYMTFQPPVITLSNDTIFADKDETKLVTVGIESQRGAKSLAIYRIEGDEEVLAELITIEGEPTNVDVPANILFTNETVGIKLVVTDVVDKTTEASIKAIVNLEFVESIPMGSHVLANGNSNAPDVYAMFSLKDMTTYSVDYGLLSPENASNLDMKFYCFGGQAVLRMYAMDGGTGTKSNEFKGSDGGSALDLEVQNKTRLLKLPDFDFDNASAATIGEIPVSNIVSNGVNPFLVGDVLAFVTADSSTSGGGRVGVIKILSDEQVVPGNVTGRVITFSIKFPKE